MRGAHLEQAAACAWQTGARQLTVRAGCLVQVSCGLTHMPGTCTHPHAPPQPRLTCLRVAVRNEPSIDLHTTRTVRATRGQQRSVPAALSVYSVLKQALSLAVLPDPAPTLHLHLPQNLQEDLHLHLHKFGRSDLHLHLHRTLSCMASRMSSPSASLTLAFRLTMASSYLCHSTAQQAAHMIQHTAQHSASDRTRHSTVQKRITCRSTHSLQLCQAPSFQDAAGHMRCVSVRWHRTQYMTRDAALYPSLPYFLSVPFSGSSSCCLRATRCLASTTWGSACGSTGCSSSRSSSSIHGSTSKCKRCATAAGTPY